ncbi:hypothetical protein G3I76_09905, partial [Streptomyces sp. SID11233]|nr:hypothetical protein [Streptomyces sp. SID11233]
DEQLPEAVKELGLSGPDAEAEASEAWRVAVDTGLVEVSDPEEDGEEYGSAAPGEDLAQLTSGSPQDALGLWLG